MKREYCADFDNPDPRFSYENDGCGPCTNQRKYPPVAMFPLTTPVYQKCLKGHTVKNYIFRIEALKRSLKKRKNFVIQVKLPNEISSDALREKLEQVLQSEVMILMEGIGILGAGYVDTEFVDMGGLNNELESIPPDDESSTGLEELESLPEEENLGPQESP